MATQAIVPPAVQADLFLPVLTHLDHLTAQDRPFTEHTWQDWQIKPVSGGRNNLLYRITSNLGDFAVKFTIRDERQRARREYEALRAVQQAGLAIAPRPILLEQHRFSQPVVVQSWLNGPVIARPPQTEAEWVKLLHLFATLKAVTPDQTTLPLRRAIVNFDSPAAGLEAIQAQLNRIPPAERPKSLAALWSQVETTHFPSWPTPEIALCHVDPNIQNVIRRSAGWAFVDWENSGWGDLAFEIADLMTHPAYFEVPLSRWVWVGQTYCHLSGDPTAARRIQVYYCLMLVWWVARWTRYLYEIPRGLDERLVAHPDGWQANVEAKRQSYLQLAWAVGRQAWGWPA